MNMIIVTACQSPEYSHFEYKSFWCQRSMLSSIYGVILIKCSNSQMSTGMWTLQNIGD